jgi:hypothetical protein
MVSLISAEVSF